MGLSIDREVKQKPRGVDFGVERVNFSVGWLGSRQEVACIGVQGSIPGVGLFAERVYVAPEQATSMQVELRRDMPSYTFTAYSAVGEEIARHTIGNLAGYYLANGITGVNVC